KVVQHVLRDTILTDCHSPAPGGRFRCSDHAWTSQFKQVLTTRSVNFGERGAILQQGAHCIYVLEQLLARTRYGHDPITEIGKLSDFLIAQFPNATEPAPKLHR